jgi:acyl dehydratase
MDSKPLNLDDLQKFVGRELGVSDWLTVDQSRIDQFAECTGDHQWIHVDVDGRNGKVHSAHRLRTGISRCRF